MNLERYWHSCTLVTDCNDNKQVVVVGGSNGNGGETSTEIYDVNSGTWSEGTKELSVLTILCVRVSTHMRTLSLSAYENLSTNEC